VCVPSHTLYSFCFMRHVLYSRASFSISRGDSVADFNVRDLSAACFWVEAYKFFKDPCFRFNVNTDKNVNTIKRFFSSYFSC